MEQIRAPQAAPEWPSAELGIGEKRSLRKGVKSAFKGTLRDIGLEVAKAPVWRRIIDASRLSLLCEASLAVKGPWMATTCRAGMKEPVEKTSWSCAELLEFAP